MQSRSETLSAFTFEDTVQAELQTIWQVVEPHIDHIIDQFYRALDESSQLTAFQAEKSWRAHARARQIEHLRMLFGGRFGDDYFKSVEAVGAVHFRIELPFLHYTAAYALIAAEVQALIVSNFQSLLGSKQKLNRLLRTANDAFFLDIQAATQAYMKAAQREQQIALTAIKGALDDMASGELERRIPDTKAEPFPSRFAEIRHAFNDLGQILYSVFGEIRNRADMVRGSVSSLTETSSNLARRSQDQSAFVEQAATSVQHMLHSVDNTEQLMSVLLKRSNDNSTAAQHGASIMEDARDAMQKIQSASREINTIVDVIDDISFQTNLLALNAGVEAARAGEAGKGFAVVASEVRGLAQRSAESARSIRDLISRSSDIIQHGSELMEASSNSLSEILSNAGEVASGVEEIRTVASEQATSLRAVGNAISMIETATHENAATAEAVNDTCRSLKQGADDLANPFELFQAATTHKEDFRSSSIAAE